MELIKISDYEYHKLPHISASKLKLLLDSPMEFKTKTWGMPSHVMNIGTYTHLRVLEPEKLLPENIDQYVVAIDAKSDKTKKFAEAFEANPDKLVIRQVDIDEANLLADAALAKKEITDIFSDGVSEMAIIGELPGIGPAKCKLDWIKLESNHIYDLKTASVGRGGIKPYQSIMDYNYHIQNAFYRKMAEALGLDGVEFSFVFLFKNKSYDRLICSLDDSFQNYADTELEKLLNIYKTCMESDIWGGKFGPEEIQITLPKWLN